MTTLDESSAPALPIATPSRWTWLDFVLLASVVILAGLTSVGFQDAELSMDELWHLAITAGRGTPFGHVPADQLLSGLPSQTTIVGAEPFWTVWTHIDGALHPPLYFFTLRIWRELFGDTDFAARLYTSAWSLVAVGFIFATARMTMDRWLAWIAGVIIAVSQTQMYFAQETRGYQMLIAIGAIALWMMTRIELNGPTRRRAILLAAITLPLLLTHYFAAGAAIAIALYGGLKLRGHRGVFFISLVASAAVYLVAWVPFAIRQIDDLHTGDAFLRVESFGYAHEFMLLLCSPYRLLTDRGYRVEMLAPIAGVLFILPWFLIRRFRALLPWAIWLAGSILALATLDVVRSTDHLNYPRYFAVATPAVVLLVLGCARSLDRPPAYLCGVLLLLLVLLVRRPDERISVDCPDYSGARNYVAQNIQAGEGVVIYHGIATTEYADMLVMTFSHDRTFAGHPLLKTSGPLSREEAATLPNQVWLVTGGFETTVDAMIPGAKVLKRKPWKDQALLLHLRLRGDDPDSATMRPDEPSATFATPQRE